MSNGLIISLGGSPEPIARTIVEHQPQIVCYLASQESVFLLGDVKKMVQDQGVTVPNSKVVLLNDANDLVHCFEKALECAKYLGEKQVPPDKAIVDFTGGTKCMTAALALATVREGYAFSYVGGTVRNKNGLGTVQSGTEVVYTGVSPWQIFAVEEWQYLVLYLKHYQCEAALSLIEETLPRQPKSEQLCWQAVKSTIDGLLKWDQFNHKEALPTLSAGAKDLEKWISIKNDARLRDFLQQTKKCFEFLQKTAMATKCFQKLDKFLLVDLLSNAERRAAQGRYDDAMARLYRALEMYGQIAFLEQTNASTSDVPETILPESLREEYLSRYKDEETGKIQIPLFATFRVLEELGDPAGQRFRAQQEEFSKILSARNQSILAHGIQSVSKATFEKFLGLLRPTFNIDETVTFPCISENF